MFGRGYLGKDKPVVRVESARTVESDGPEAGPGPVAGEDEELLAKIAQGNQLALATLYRRRGCLIYSLLVRMLVNEMEAQEVMQDTFIRIWQRAAQYGPGRSSPLAWMLMIARGRAFDRLRARSP